MDTFTAFLVSLKYITEIKYFKRLLHSSIVFIQLLIYADIYFKSLYKLLQHFLKNSPQIYLWKKLELIRSVHEIESSDTVLTQYTDLNSILHFVMDCYAGECV